MASSLLVLVALLALVGMSSAITCWQGNSTRIGKTGPGLQSPQVVDCGPNVRYCFKSMTRVDYNDAKDKNKPVNELRTCGDSSRCSRKHCDGNSSNKRCCCDKNLCNTATASSFLAVLALPLLGRFI